MGFEFEVEEEGIKGEGGEGLEWGHVGGELTRAAATNDSITISAGLDAPAPLNTRPLSLSL